MRDVARLVSELVAIESVNPTLVAGGSGEAALAAFVAAWLEGAGLDVRVDDVTPGRPNVVGVRRGRGGGRSLLLLAHTDTVVPGGMAAPFAPVERDGRLYGRGAYDMKGGLAAAMLAAAMLAAAAVGDLDGDLVVAAVCDEEAGGIGTRALLESRWFDAAVVTEPTDLDVGIAHKGFFGFEIRTTGRAAHGSRPDLGEDAILKLGPVLVELAALDARLREGDSAARPGRRPSRPAGRADAGEPLKRPSPAGKRASLTALSADGLARLARIGGVWSRPGTPPAFLSVDSMRATEIALERGGAGSSSPSDDCLS